MSRHRPAEIPFTRCAVVCTSTGSLDYFGKINTQIPQLRLHVYLADDQPRLDGVDISADTFYRWMMDNPSKLPTTSPPALGDAIELFLKLHRKKYSDVIVTTIASSLSQSMQIIRQAAILVSQRIRVHIFDTGTTSAPEGVFAIEAMKQLEQGKEVSAVLARLEELKQKCVLFCCVDSLNYLVKNGRMSVVKGFVATILKIKPILQLQNNQMFLKETVRNTDAALDAVVRHVADYLQTHDAAEEYVLYCGNDTLHKRFSAKLKLSNGISPQAYALTPVVGAHIGPNAVGIALFVR